MSSIGVKLVMEVIGGVYDGAYYEFTEFPVTIGRLEDEDICLIYDSLASKEHAEIILEDGASNLFIIDKNSTNGTKVHDRNVSGQQRLLSGDRLRIGNTVFNCTINIVR